MSNLQLKIHQHNKSDHNQNQADSNHHLLEIIGFNGAIRRDFNTILLPCTFINNGERSFDIGRWRDPRRSGEVERVEERGGGGGGGRKQVSCKGG